MAQAKPFSELLFVLVPWWVPAVLADAAYFAPKIAIQFYPPVKSVQGLPIYNEFVMNVEMLSPYFTVVFCVCALLLLLKKTMTVHKKAGRLVHGKKHSGEQRPYRSRNKKSFNDKKQ